LANTQHKTPWFWFAAGLLLVALSLVLTYPFIDPAPPKQIRISTGAEQNAYYQFARQYSQQLQPQGIELEVLASAGSVENLQRLIRQEIDLAFVQGGVTLDNSVELRTLASLYFEPLWVFYRKPMEPKQLSELSGKRIAIGEDGSGTLPIAQLLLDNNGINADNSQLLKLNTLAAVNDLQQGRLDALFMVTSATSKLVLQLLQDPQIGLFSFSRAHAYQRKHPFLSSVSLPEGVIDLERNIPDRSVELLAPAATLVSRKDFHPALVVQILETAKQLHSHEGLFEHSGQFPSPEYGSFELHPDAEHYHQSGPSLLQRYLPFWAANLIDRLVILLLPVITLVIPLIKILPPTYRWRVRSKIYRWYDQLRDLDQRTKAAQTADQVEAMLVELNEVEQEVMRVEVPKSYADNQYNLRLHLQLIRYQLQQKRGPAAATAATSENNGKDGD
jgi:TRAP transporter TAXI family solute receptor